MSISNIRQNIAYGFTDPLLNVFPAPILATRTPTDNDKAQIGQIWIHEETNDPFILTSIVDNQANWVPFAGGAGSGIMTLTGDVGGAVGPLAGNVNILGGVDIAVTGNPGTSTLTIDIIADFSDQFDTDAGNAVPAGGVLNVFGAPSSAGININTSGAGNTVGIALNDVLLFSDTNSAGTEGVIYFGGERFLHNFGDSNTFVGKEAGNFTLNPAFPPAGANTGVGSGSLFSLVNSDSNSALGAFSLFACTDGDNSCAIGTNSLSAITTGRINDALGANTGIAGGGPGVVTGSFNIFIGGGDSVGGIIASGGNYTSSESSNILIRNAGLQGEDNTIRIGTQGSSNAQQDTCFIAGIVGVTVANAQTVTINSATGQLGITTGGAGFTWNTVTGTTQAMVSDNGYIANNAGLVTLTLPTVAAVGDEINVVFQGAGGWLVAQNAGQSINLGNVATTVGVGGSLASSAAGDSIEMICITANTTFTVISSMGNITIA